MFFEHPSRDAFGSKDTAHSPRGCRCAACSNWRERVPSSTAGRTSSLNGTAEVSRARTLLSGRNPRWSPKQWPGEHTSGPGDGAWLTCVRVRAGARFLGCCGPRLACGCDGKCARPAGAADACPLEASAALAPTSRATRHGSAWNVGTSGGRPPSPPAQVCAPQSVHGKRRPQGSCSGPHGRVLCILLSAWGTGGSAPPAPRPPFSNNLSRWGLRGDSREGAAAPGERGPGGWGGGVAAQRPGCCGESPWPRRTLRGTLRVPNESSILRSGWHVQTAEARGQRTHDRGNGSELTLTRPPLPLPPTGTREPLEARH